MDGDKMDMVARTGEDMPGGFFFYRADEDEDILYANDVVLDIFGCKTLEQFKELTGYTFKGMVHPDDLAAVESSITQQIAESDKNLDYVEYRITRRDGAVRWVEDYGRFVHTKELGDVYYVLIRDITDVRFSREESVRRAEVIEGLSADFTSIFLLNLDTGTMRPYRLNNAHFRKIAGTDEEPDWKRVLPVYARSTVQAEDQQRFLQEVDEDRIRERITEEQTYSFVYRATGDAGDMRYMEMSLVRVNGDALMHHVVLGFRDVTKRTLGMQKELADKLNMELALEREKRANEIKSSFLFNISHDLRTPMNAIKGFTDLAMRHLDEPEKVRDYLSKVDESNRHLLSLIDDLLEMSRIDYGKVSVKEEPCSLRKELDVVLDMFRAQAEEKKLTVEEKVDLPGKEVLVDALRFRRIMGNLVGNAVKFTPEGGRITVAARQRHVSESGYARYEFEVADTGIGMSEDFMRRMYEAFEREESSTRSGYIGTGLGLTIAKRLLESMGGSISVKSKQGEGSTFTVGLPLKLAGSVPPGAATVPRQEHKASGGHRILLVEDIEINRMLAEQVLIDAGFVVDSVADGSDAVEAIKEHEEWYYDLVLMDIQMPVMNGYEATRAIRAMGRADTAELPIIALSANARDEDKRMSMESGMNSHVAKPFDIAHLITTINDHIGARKR